MSDIAAHTNLGDTKPCKVCGEPIKRVARVCVHCNNYQNWRSELNISGTVLSLLVALLSVLTVLVPVIKEALTIKNSSLSFAFQGATDTTISVLSTNQGARPGSVGYPVKLSVIARDEGGAGMIGHSVGPLSLSNAANAVAVLVQPNSSLLLTYSKTASSDPGLLAPDEKDVTCTLDVRNTDFRAVEFDCPCCHRL